MPLIEQFFSLHIDPESNMGGYTLQHQLLNPQGYSSYSQLSHGLLYFGEKAKVREGQAVLIHGVSGA